MGRPSLLAAVEALGLGAFVADTAPVIYRVERGAAYRLIAACDPLFDAVERRHLGCLVSAISVAELLVRPFRAGPSAVAVVDAFLHQPMVGIAEADGTIARMAASMVADGRSRRLADAFVAATANYHGVPLVTGDRRLARADLAETFLVADYGP